MGQGNFLYMQYGRSFDSVFTNRDLADNFSLTLLLIVKVHFRPVESQNGPGVGHYPEEDDRFGSAYTERMLFQMWQRSYKDRIDHFWRHRFWMLPPEDFNALDMGKIRPNIQCQLEVETLPTSAGAHHVFNIMSQAEHRVNRVRAGGPGFTGWLADTGRGSNPETEAKLITVKDIGHLLMLPMKAREFVGLNRYYHMQTPFVALGSVFESSLLHYVDSAIGRTDNYATAIADIEPWHAYPWQMAIGSHTKTDPHKWKVVSKQPKPQMVT